MLKYLTLPIFLSVGITAVSVGGQEQTLNVEALATIEDFSAKLCGDYLEGGSSSTMSASGEAQAELTGLFKKLADLGITGAASINSEEYVGVLREDLGEELQSARECKLAVLDSLKEAVIQEVVKAPPPAPTLQADNGVRLWNEDTFQFQLEPSEIREVRGMELYEALMVSVEQACVGPGYVVYSWQVREPYPTGGEITITRTLQGGLEDKLATGSSGQVNLGWCSVHRLKNTSINPINVQVRYASAAPE